MLETYNLFALEYSFQQKMWRIINLEEALQYIIGWFAKGRLEKIIRSWPFRNRDKS